ncbi:hypothetical protein Cfor_12478 [Coptotermes formosanus]|uniref:Sodium channel and clathrin linker 1 n=1 Tax=Coptotermes formosanus TaxID=36987 RepID=A0A6L2PXI9_COPFO|nr:hypothetical protein Cfor_12478 [Coptotermes formosanus]
MDNKNTSGIKDVIPAPSNASQYAETDSLLPSLLHEYEAFVGALQQQIDFYKAEHASLRSDLKELVTENRHLSDKLKNVLSTKFKNESTMSPRHKKGSDMVTNLQQQLSMVAQERDSAVEMWNLALREVDNLEEALKSYNDSRHMDLTQKKNENMKQDFSNAVTVLESKLATARSILVKEKATREEIQKKLEQSLQQNAALLSTLKSREQELEKSLEGQCETARKLQQMEKKAKELQEQVETIEMTENDLESALTHCHGCIEELVKKKLEALEKVSESLQLVERAMAEKDTAVLQETRIREENVQLQKMLASIIDEAGARVKEEMENIKQQYNKKLEILLHDMKRIEDENSEKNRKLQKEIQEKYVLEEKLQKMQVESPVAATVLEKKLTMAYDELLSIKHYNMQLGIEKENLRSELERLQESHAVEIRKMSIEHHLMEEQILGLQAQLEAENRVKNKAGEHLEKLAEQAHLMEQLLEKGNLMSKQELQQWQRQQYAQEHQELVKQIQEIQKQSSATASEFEHHLEKQHQMKTKYQKAMKTMTEKFVLRLQELRSEVNVLRKENKILKSDLHKIQEETDIHKSSEKNM